MGEDVVAVDKIFIVNRPGIAYREGMILDWTEERMPNAGTDQSGALKQAKEAPKSLR